MVNHMKKAQVTIEFVSMVIISLVVCLFILGLLSSWHRDSSNEYRQSRIRLLGYEIQEELILASEVHEGYNRTFVIPEKILNYNYTINNTFNRLILSSHDEEFYFPIPLVQGNLSKGENNILNKGGVVVIK